ncbi:cystathionine beta-synthase [Puccinia graminis f. sp. tritici]|uniref:cystathionine beta-synthase n=1 Tax=Puccinia graminis f. sp. tritici TaxID=56615 RepID=A0A5B0QPY5_PUCGR|nr:cystathionine beta-synthase [Puccinia graminis f. sp. tritici]
MPHGQLYQNETPSTIAPTPIKEPIVTPQEQLELRVSSTHEDDPIKPRIDGSILTISDSVLSCIGATPLVRLDRLAKKYNLKCNLLAKLEYYNAGGSVKDRIALRMIVEAEREGILIPGKSVIIEPTSGNTGIGLALAAAVKNYRCIIVMPQKMSREKINMMKALGTEIVRTPTEAAFDSPESHLSVAARLQKAIPGAIILNQYRNRFNPQTHFDTTGLEIIQAIQNTPSTLSRPSSGQVDLFIAGAGTGGTISGVSRRLKTHYGADRVKAIAVDPVGSILAKPESLNSAGIQSYQTEGTGYDFEPEVLDYSLIDQWIKVDDQHAFETLRELIKLEGTLCGGSSGQALYAALQYLKPADPARGAPPGNGWELFGQNPRANVVVLCADSIRNYITKDWLVEGTEESETTEAALLSKAQHQT